MLPVRALTVALRRWLTLPLLALALALVLTAFLLQAFIDLNLSDEGYLWYGAIAVTKGQVPLRDFQSYDPGRYYWAAAWLRLLDPGIIPLRIACAAFYVPGILCGLLVLRRLNRAWWVLVPGGALLTLWLFPWFMLNHTLALAAVYIAVLLIERPSSTRHLLAGVFVGLAAVFARNVGAYLLASFAALILLVWWRIDRRDLLRRVLAWGSGIVVGYAPMLLMLLFVPGFWEANLDNMRFLVEIGSTNLGRPVPWPWNQTALWDACVGVFFVLAPAFFALAAGWVLVSRSDALVRRRVLVASTLIGLPYLHYAFSRADIEHMAMGIHPLLLGIIALPFGAARPWRSLAVGLVAGVAAVSLVAAGEVSSFYQWATAPAGWYVPARLGRWTVWMPRPEAAFIEGTIRFEAAMVRPDEGFLIAPHLGPGLYAILNRDSPVWQIYFLFPHPEWRQRRLIEDFERNRVGWVLLEDIRTDRREDLRFRNTHRLLWEHITRTFEPFPVDGLPARVELLRRRGAPT